jgi:hypothetical protein
VVLQIVAYAASLCRLNFFNHWRYIYHTVGVCWTNILFYRKDRRRLQALRQPIHRCPSLFYPTSSALPLIGYTVLERISSLLFHFSWSYLCVFAALFRKKLFLLAALPMGLVDSLVPFVGSFGIFGFEMLVFMLSVACLAITVILTSNVREESAPSLTSLQSLLDAGKVRSHCSL